MAATAETTPPALAPPVQFLVDGRLLQLCCRAIGLGLTAALAAQILTRLIALITTDDDGDTRIHVLIRRMPVYVYDTSTARDAADQMARHRIGRLPVVTRSNPKQLAGIVTRSDILSVFERRLQENKSIHPSAHWKGN